MSRILIVEDDQDIASFIKRGLEAEGYACDIADNGALALGLAQSNSYQLVVLDLSLPLLDGTDVLTKLRAAGVDVPVIVLTARTALKDRVRALEGGADDYMPKPFQFAELLARVRLRLQDSAPAAELTGATGRNEYGTLNHGELTLDIREHRVLVNGKWKDLSRRELGLLETFMRHPRMVLSRAQLLSQVWGLDFDPGSNVVDVYIATLRKKIGAQHLETIRGAGYRLL
ncbi:response regulator transcription factor [Corynebacterium sp.]|uniref:response regulator transcription factor n=1 Tax=Corynebacterium sp. TaxID=1720 RepID=UPI002648F58C|nr:response regulator transcription factor [Corynebacterium sp.]MDN6137325.1 response regulator transcription factor [Corynebacterium sp.]MDN6738234.1 response regulator transcription factor [Corynebacterium sp.]